MRPQINLGFPPREEIDNIIQNQCSGLKKEVDRLIDLFWVLCSKNKNIGAVAPRDVIYLFGWAAKLSEFEASGGSKALAEARTDCPYLLQKEQSYTGIKPEHLEQAFHKLFNNGTVQKI
jgi:hypothetical protein